MYGLPGEGSELALTIDDGTSSEVVAAFVAFAADSGVRLTFFPNGCYRSWTDNAAALRPLVESGQVAFGNHTWSHPDLTTLGDQEVAEEITRNQDFLRTTFGVRTARSSGRRSVPGTSGSTGSPPTSATPPSRCGTARWTTHGC